MGVYERREGHPIFYSLPLLPLLLLSVVSSHFGGEGRCRIGKGSSLTMSKKVLTKKKKKNLFLYDPSHAGFALDIGLELDRPKIHYLELGYISLINFGSI